LTTTFVGAGALGPGRFCPVELDDHINAKSIAKNAGRKLLDGKENSTEYSFSVGTASLDYKVLALLVWSCLYAAVFCGVSRLIENKRIP
jgi:hypothetical protein